MHHYAVFSRALYVTIRFLMNDYTVPCGFQPVTMRHYTDFSQCPYVIARITTGVRTSYNDLAGEYALLCGMLQTSIRYQSNGEL